MKHVALVIGHWSRYLVFLLVLSIFLVGCTCSAVKDQTIRSAKANDAYAELVKQTLDGSIKPKDGNPVTSKDWSATPSSVRELLTNVIRALCLNRKAWHQAAFALGVGADPASMDLKTPKLPE